MPFKIVSENKPKGDQPQAIKKLIDGLEKRKQSQVLLGNRLWENIYNCKCY